MERIQHWILWFALIQLFLNLSDAMLNGRKLTTSDFISIDCGASIEYTDHQTGISYKTDSGFVETGYNSMVAPDQRYDVDYPYFGRQLQTLRSFPEGKRNCYTLKPEQGKHHTYLIRAYFVYGNYDGKNQIPTFDLYLGVNHWDTIESLSSDYYLTEIIHTPNTDTIHVCLVKRAVGVPSISALELRPLINSLYQTPSPSQSLLINRGRFDVASTSSATHSRYKDDIYDRIWRKIDMPQDWYQINGTIDIDPSRTNNSYKLPMKVLKSAAQSFNLSYALNYDYDSVWKNLDKSSKYFVYFHFCEIQPLPPEHKRILNIIINVGDEYVYTQPIALEYLKPQTIAPQIKDQGYVRFNISATSESDAPPILNAFEVYEFISPLPSPTDQRDVHAIMNIKDTYKISNLDWQGDPCVSNLAWDGLSCSFGINDTNSRIISMNLSATKLTGQITTSFSQLTELESL
ncbi:hypothetical protein K1719_046408 [Acacia pycnantha]|nr:hypothetical protein K1719_046408 [Acacia pycnantha]